MNLYYIADKEKWNSSIDVFHPNLGSHYIDLPDGRILVSCHFPESEASQEHWESLEGVERLPHPTFEASVPIKRSHALALGHLGIKEFDTVLHVARAAAKRHPLMKLRGF